jgi:hypothetical protein
VLQEQNLHEPQLKKRFLYHFDTVHQQQVIAKSSNSRQHSITACWTSSGTATLCLTRTDHKHHKGKKEQWASNRA